MGGLLYLIRAGGYFFAFFADGLALATALTFSHFRVFALMSTASQNYWVPDDGRTYPLPAGLGAFPLRSLDDFPATAPASWLQRGGIVMPMDQSEALWISFSARYPCAGKIAAGKINAVSGEAWTAELHSEPQDDVVVSGQPWLDGFSVSEGFIRQFVALPPGAGYSVEEQLTGRADVGGMQLQVVPLSAEAHHASSQEETIWQAA